MKFFALASALIFMIGKSQANECGQGKVANKLQFCFKPNYIEGCSSYESQDNCQSCEAGYELNKSGGCDALEFQERQQKIVGCLGRNIQDSSRCSNCADGYIRTDGKCFTGVKHCQKYNNGACIQCERNFSLVLNECRYNILLGCRKSSSTHTCLECEKPFQLKGETCFIKNCKALNDYGCITCDCGYYLQHDRTCHKFQRGCLRYERGRCINCLPHYRLKGGICEIEGCLRYHQNLCVKCKVEYANENGGCNFRDCVDWSNDHCLSCQEGFRNEAGICRQQKSERCV